MPKVQWVGFLALVYRMKWENAMKKESKKKYDKPVSLHPLKPEEALSAFMKVDPVKFERRRKQEKNRRK